MRPKMTRQTANWSKITGLTGNFQFLKPYTHVYCLFFFFRAVDHSQPVVFNTNSHNLHDFLLFCHSLIKLFFLINHLFRCFISKFIYGLLSLSKSFCPGIKCICKLFTSFSSNVHVVSLLRIVCYTLRMLYCIELNPSFSL